MSASLFDLRLLFNTQITITLIVRNKKSAPSSYSEQIDFLFTLF